jgi:hypothetical protein
MAELSSKVDILVMMMPAGFMLGTCVQSISATGGQPQRSERQQENPLC